MWSFGLCHPAVWYTGTNIKKEQLTITCKVGSTTMKIRIVCCSNMKVPSYHTMECHTTVEYNANLLNCRNIEFQIEVSVT
jgi:hypothetical protein